MFSHANNDSKVVIGLMKQLQTYLKAHPELHNEAALIHQEDWATALSYYISYCKASEETQQLVLQEMFNSPTGEDVQTAAPLRRTAAEAKVLAGMAADITKVLKIFAAVAAGSGGTAAEVKPAIDDPETVQRVLLASELNVHTMGGGWVWFGAAAGVGSRDGACIVERPNKEAAAEVSVSVVLVRRKVSRCIRCIPGKLGFSCFLPHPAGVCLPAAAFDFMHAVLPCTTQAAS
jgi:hypothetical protein